MIDAKKMAERVADILRNFVRDYALRARLQPVVAADLEVVQVVATLLFDVFKAIEVRVESDLECAYKTGVLDGCKPAKGDVAAIALYDKLQELGWQFSDEQQEIVLGLLTLVVKHVTSVPVPAAQKDSIITHDLSNALQGLLSAWATKCSYVPCSAPATGVQSRNNGTHYYCDKHRHPPGFPIWDSQVTDIASAGIIRQAMTALSQHAELRARAEAVVIKEVQKVCIEQGCTNPQMPPYAICEMHANTMEPCDTFGCKNPKRRVDVMCKDCFVDYRTDPDAYK